MSASATQGGHNKPLNTGPL